MILHFCCPNKFLICFLQLKIPTFNIKVFVVCSNHDHYKLYKYNYWLDFGVEIIFYLTPQWLLGYSQHYYRPPKSSMFSCIQWRAAIWSKIPKLLGIPLELPPLTLRKPEMIKFSSGWSWEILHCPGQAPADRIRGEEIEGSRREEKEEETKR